MEKIKCECTKTKQRTIDEKEVYYTRLNKISGQVNGIKNMIESDRYCDDVIIQLLAVESSIKSLTKILFKNHLETCIVNDIQKGDSKEATEEIMKLINRF